MKRLVAFVPVLLIATTLAASAQTITWCGPRTEVVRKVEHQFGETRRGMGLRGQGSVMELFTSDERGTWSLVRTYTNGESCVEAVGQDWTPDRVEVGVAEKDPT
ncbi:hypothetical protein [Actibacterium sp. 188UL27-1]|uniref:hypothetical protein n=1 Tax=Actibacterium sp. 188UL27-1 TaxID=2786961 RepID=UPI00195635AD|nr:hypothetical protein [Actibacterium sp. 188UL27-1]MBM7069445.1 hypothetical protein [Actibacterium sp. 188UL27-1]